MGREFPQFHHHENEQEIHPFLTISFLIATVAATVSVVSSLCGALSRKKPPPGTAAGGHEAKENRDVNLHVNPPTDDNHVRHDGYADNDSPPPLGGEECSQQRLPPPPGKRNMSGSVSYHFRSSSAASTSSVSSQLKKLPQSMSMRSLGNGIGIGSKQSSKNLEANNDNHHHKKHKEKKYKHEDSIWKKTIILGEKCRVPDEDDEDAIVYDEKGNQIQTYHRKTTSSILSRQNSSVDHDVIHPNVEHGHKDEVHLKNALVGGRH